MLDSVLLKVDQSVHSSYLLTKTVPLGRGMVDNAEENEIKTSNAT